MNRSFLFVCFPLLLSAFFIFTECSNKNKRETQLTAAEKELQLKGKQLSEKHCQGCHLLPDPGLLDKASWMRVFPVMKIEMTKSSLQVTNDDWALLQQYYGKFSPVSVDNTNPKLLSEANQLFVGLDSLLELPNRRNFITLIKFDDSKKTLYTGDASGNISIFKSGHLTENLKMENIPIDLNFTSHYHDLEILGVGSLAPSEKRSGQLIKIDQATGEQTIIIDSLKRPLHYVREDFNGDGSYEYLISCFGSTIGEVNSGNLSLFHLKNEVYREKVIKQLPGSIKSAVGDFNRDGKQDIVALFSQGKESVFMFVNKGNLEFEEKMILEFPPVYGSNNFEVADVNNDSYIDIILTNGDNGDYSPVYKYYHGVRIFVNNGKNEFKEEFFFHLNGASKVIIKDFDRDNDQDLAVLSMYPNLFVRPQETIVYFENLGSLEFAVSYLEKEPTAKWMIMESGDIDEDGDEDLITGSNYMLSFTIPNYYKEKWKKESVPLKVFLNNLSENED